MDGNPITTSFYHIMPGMSYSRGETSEVVSKETNSHFNATHVRMCQECGITRMVAQSSHGDLSWDGMIFDTHA